MIRRFKQFSQTSRVHIQRGERLAVIAERMAGNIQSGNIFFQTEHHAQVIFGNIGQRGLDFIQQAVAKERQLSGHVAAAVFVCAVQRTFVYSHQLRALCAGAIHRAGKDQRFDDALVDLLGIHARAEIKDILIRAAPAALFDDGIDGLVAAGLDSAKTEADTAHAFRIFADGEFAHALIDIRREERNAVLAAVLRIFCNLAAVGRDGIEQRGEELHRVVALEPARAHSDYAVSRRMGFVECVGRESGHFVEKLAGDFGAHAVAHTAGHDDFSVLFQTVDEDFALLGHHVMLLFCHCAAHEIASSIRIARQIADNLHDLLLIDHAAIGDIQNGLELGMQVVNGIRVIFAIDIAGDGIHRAGAVERNGGDDVFKILRLHVGQEAAHAAGFKLEHAVRFALGDHVVDGLVVQWNVFGFHIHACVAHQVERVANDGQRAQTEKIHLEQTEFFNRAHRELRGDDLVVALKRHVIGDRFIGDEHARRMGGRMAGQTFERTARIDQALDARVLLIVLFQFRRNFQRAGERHVQLKRDGFGNGVYLGIWIAQHAAHVAHDRAGAHRSERDDLADVIRAVTPGDVIDDLLTALITEIHIDIRHGDAFRIEESLEQQAVTQRIELGDIHAVSDDGAGARTASGPDDNALTAGVVDEIPDNEEVIDVTHLGNHADFVFHAVARFRRDGLIALGKPFFTQAAEHLLAGFARLGGEAGQLGFAEDEIDVTALGNFLCALDGIGVFGKDFAHFLFALDVQLAGFHAHAVGIVERLAGLDAHEHFLRVRVFAAEVVAVICRQQGNARFAADLHEQRYDAFFVFQIVIHDFHEIMPLAENAFHLAGMGACGFKITVQQQPIQLAGQTGARRDQALAVFFERRHIHAGTIIKAARPAFADQLGQVLIALLRFAQQNQVIHGAHAVGGAAVVHIFAHIDFAADDRVNAALFRLGIKIHHAIHHAVVGDGAGVHAQLFNAVEQWADAVCAVQQAVFGMQVKMCESHVICSLSVRLCDGGKGNGSQNRQNVVGIHTGFKGNLNVLVPGFVGIPGFFAVLPVDGRAIADEAAAAERAHANVGRPSVHIIGDDFLLAVLPEFVAGIVGIAENIQFADFAVGAAGKERVAAFGRVVGGVIVHGEVIRHGQREAVGRKIDGLSAGNRGDALGILVVSIQPQRDAAPDGEADNKRQNVLNRGFFHESSFSKTKINHSYCKPGTGKLSSRWKHNKKQAEYACFSPWSVKFQSSIHAGKLYAISQKIKKRRPRQRPPEKRGKNYLPATALAAATRP